ncbi:hypothetical protein SCLCIDRAFT_1206904 [Scleroderma citrinum Foug A]|uniref:Uncharacterized protein n=1 Tax=Scleroderma citrinum Foug A TaxID=1036808 RepID=A0A0C3ESE2_9AGAM|nr:hypothetical protein SCLCIDRAFT_1206904 [Scleroderma citrinum Foug A]
MDCSEFNTSSPVEIGDTQLHDKASQSTQAAPAGNGDVPSEPTAERPSEPVSLEDILAQTVTSFTLLSSISSRIEGFTEKDEALRKEYRRLLFRLVMKMYAWSSARIFYECCVRESNLETQANSLQQAERERDDARQRLLELLSMVNRALEISKFA